MNSSKIVFLCALVALAVSAQSEESIRVVGSSIRVCNVQLKKAKCAECKYLVHRVQTAIADNMTEVEAEAMLKHDCQLIRRVMLRKECVRQVSHNLHTMWTDLSG